MYGTVARVRVKPGMEAKFADYSREIGVGTAPGQIGVYVYRMDRDSREHYLVAMFESREAYHANAQSPEQHARFMQLMEMLEAEPEWNDGEIVMAVNGK